MIAAMKVWLSAGVEVAVVCLIVAIVWNEPRMEALLTGAPSADSRLIFAAWAGDLEALEDALKDGARAGAGDGGYGTALHFAAMSGHVRTARRLLDEGADVNAGNDWGLTPLMFAARNNQAEMIELLLDQGADPRRRANDGAVTIMDMVQMGDATEAGAVLERRVGRPHGETRRRSDCAR